MHTITVGAIHQGKSGRHDMTIEIRGKDGQPPYTVRRQDNHDGNTLPCGQRHGGAPERGPRQAERLLTASATGGRFRSWLSSGSNRCSTGAGAPRPRWPRAVGATRNI